ncbi:MAG TPA: UpxY family transcription antiterminator [Bryobacteraceae bacterium]|nr:UpxY family transcription antiterminator [Bryobacteraceae bacterium]
MSGPERWYAIRVKSNRENIVAASLGGKGLPRFLPTYVTRRQWSDRLVETEVPLFKGYVFCFLDAAERMPVLTIPGVIELVGIGKTPHPVEDAEIEALQTIARNGLPTAPWPFLEAGQRVRIERGPLKDVEGLLIEVKNRFRLVVSVSLLQRSVAVEVDRESVTPLRKPFTGSIVQRSANGVPAAARPGRLIAWR